MPISIIGTFGASLYFFTKVLTEYILKKKMIEKGYVNDDTQAIFRNTNVPNRYGSLKWGLLAFFGGSALILIDQLDLERRSVATFGIILIALSVAFFIYFYIVKRDLSK